MTETQKPKKKREFATFRVKLADIAGISKRTRTDADTVRQYIEAAIAPMLARVEQQLINDGEEFFKAAKSQQNSPASAAAGGAEAQATANAG